METYRVHLVTGEIQPVNSALEKYWSSTSTGIDSNHGKYRVAVSREWNADRSNRLLEPVGIHIWHVGGAVPEKVYERYYQAYEMASGGGVSIDGWYYWNELVDGTLQIRGVDLQEGTVVTTTDTTFEKAGAKPAGRSVPHLVSFFGGTGFVDVGGMIATTQEGIYLWDKEENVIRRASSRLPFFFSSFFNGTTSTRWMLLRAVVNTAECLFVRDQHAAGVIDPLTNRLIPEP